MELPGIDCHVRYRTTDLGQTHGGEVGMTGVEAGDLMAWKIAAADAHSERNLRKKYRFRRWNRRFLISMDLTDQISRP